MPERGASDWDVVPEPFTRNIRSLFRLSPLLPRLLVGPSVAVHMYFLDGLRRAQTQYTGWLDVDPSADLQGESWTNLHF